VNDYTRDFGAKNMACDNSSDSMPQSQNTIIESQHPGLSTQYQFSAIEGNMAALIETIQALLIVKDLLVSSFPGMEFGEFHDRHFEGNKILALQTSKGDYEETMSLSTEARSELYM